MPNATTTHRSTPTFPPPRPHQSTGPVVIVVFFSLSKAGLKCLDIISALLDCDRSGFILRCALLPLLSPCDLRRMRLVCSRWRHAVSRHARGRWRRCSSRSDENATPPAACCSGVCGGDSGGPSLSTRSSDAGFVRCGALRDIQVQGTPHRGRERRRAPTLREKFEVRRGGAWMSSVGRC